MSENPLIALKHVNVNFANKQQVVQAVSDVSLDIEKGDVYGIIGYSGAGKSTLVRTINLLQRPSSGQVFVKGQDLTQLNAKDLRQTRKKIGMIFQHFNLMATRTIEENVVFPLKRSHLSKQEQHQRVEELLKFVGLDDKSKAYPSQLSGGQKQRVAIARALASNPEILISDEATSALDPKTTNTILDLLKRLNQELNLTIVLITHEINVAEQICNKLAVMSEGAIIEKNDTLSIFLNPQNELTSEFMEQSNSEGQLLQKLVQKNTNDKNTILLLTYDSATPENQGLIGDLCVKFQVAPRVLYSNAENIQDHLITKNLVALEGAHTADALDYLKQLPSLKVEIIARQVS